VSLTDQVRAAAREIAESPRYVRIDAERLAALDPDAPPELDAEHHYLEGSAEEVAHFLLALHQDLAGSDGGPGERGRLLELVGLADAAGTKVAAMSKGMQQRLGIAQALVGSPRLLMLDEPTSALDPVGRRVVRDLLRDLRDRGIAVVLSSHLLSEVELVCDRVAILVGGQIVARGTPAELARPRGVEVDTAEGMREFPDAGREDVPRIVADLVASGEQVYGVRLLASTLEDAYLEAVGAA